MYSIQEQFKTDALAQMSGRVRDAQLVADNLLDLSREIGMLNVRTTKASTEQLAGSMRKLLSASNPGEFLQIAASVMQPDLQLWTGYIEQLRGIAGKAAAPVTASASAVLSAPAVTWPKPEAMMQRAAADVAPAAEAFAAAAEAPLEAAIEAVPEVPAPAAVPYATAAEDSGEEATQAAAVTPPDVTDAIKDVAEAMTGASKTPPVVMAASALPPDTPAVPAVSVARKGESARATKKAVAAPTQKKAAPPSRSVPNRSRKG